MYRQVVLLLFEVVPLTTIVFFFALTLSSLSLEPPGTVVVSSASTNRGAGWRTRRHRGQ